jgi:hypothetical protein
MTRKIFTTERGVPAAGTRRTLMTGERRPALLQVVYDTKMKVMTL